MITGPLYDKLKWVALIGMPAMATLYFALAGIWGLPYAHEVVGTLVALNTFLGVVLQISSNNYQTSNARFDGNLVISEDKTGRQLYSLELNDDPELNLATKDAITFRVNQPK